MCFGRPENRFHQTHIAVYLFVFDNDLGGAVDGIHYIAVEIPNIGMDNGKRLGADGCLLYTSRCV